MQDDSFVGLRVAPDKRRIYGVAAALLGINRSELIRAAVDDFIDRRLPDLKKSEWVTRGQK